MSLPSKSLFPQNRGQWSARLYLSFLSYGGDRDKSECENYVINKDKLRNWLPDLIDEDEFIIEVLEYSAPVAYFLPTLFGGPHNYIVFQTEKFWWSIEKNCEGLIMQRGESEASVVQTCQNQVRKGWFKNVELLRETFPKNKVTLKCFINYLVESRALYNTYNTTSSNCRHFSNEVYTFFCVVNKPSCYSSPSSPHSAESSFSSSCSDG